MSEKNQDFINKVANLLVWGYDKDDGSTYEECEEPDDGYEDSHNALMALIEQARDILKQGEREILPGAMSFKIIHMMMQDVVGDYDDPNDVPEWRWVEAHASYTHVHNGRDGVWEFVLNLDYVTNEPDAFNSIPPRLEPTIRTAQAAGMAFIIFHQGT